MTVKRLLRRGLVAVLMALAATIGAVATLNVVASTAHAAPAPGNLLNGNGKCLGDFPGPQPNERLGPCSTSIPGQAWTTLPLMAGAYRLENGNGQCLSVQGASTGDGAWVDHETCNGSTAQEWTPLNALPGDPSLEYQLVNVNSGKCLGTYQAGSYTGVPAVQWDCQASAPNQRWNGTLFFGVLTDAATGQCVGVYNASTTQGQAVVEWGCQNDANQAWELDPTTHRLQNSSDGMCMGVLGASITNGAVVVQWPCNGSPDQSWSFEPSTAGASSGKFVNGNNTAMCLASPGRFSQLVQQSCSNNSSDEIWTFATSSRGA